MAAVVAVGVATVPRAVTGWPSSSARVFRSCDCWRVNCASATWPWAVRVCWACRSSSDTAPADSRSFVSFSVCSRLSSDWRARASSSSSACSASPACTTAATKVSSAAWRPASVDSSWARAASLRLARRPNRSISQVLSVSPAVSVVASLPLPLGARTALRPAPRVGRRLASVAVSWACARCTLSIATRRSRLFFSASSTQATRRGSRTQSRQAAGGSSAGAPAPTGKVAGTPACCSNWSVGVVAPGPGLAQPASNITRLAAAAAKGANLANVAKRVNRVNRVNRGRALRRRRWLKAALMPDPHPRGHRPACAPHVVPAMVAWAALSTGCAAPRA